MLAAVRDTLLARNSRLNRFALLDVAVVNPWEGKGYVVVGYGLCDSASVATPNNGEDELFGIFAIDESLTRIWHTFDVIPARRWRDWYVGIESATGASVQVRGHSVDYGPGRADHQRSYSWPSDSSYSALPA